MGVIAKQDGFLTCYSLLVYLPNNKRTMEAIKEAQTGEYAGEVDVSSMDAMLRSMQ